MIILIIIIINNKQSSSYWDTRRQRRRQQQDMSNYDSSLSTTTTFEYICWSNPLASGWLTNKFVDENWLHSPSSRRNGVGRNAIRSKPNEYIWSNLLNPDELYYWNTILPEWSKRYNKQQEQKMDDNRSTRKQHRNSHTSQQQQQSMWVLYQQKVLLSLRDMSQRYGVPISSIVLRWTLQKQQKDDELLDQLWTKRPFSTTVDYQLFSNDDDIRSNTGTKGNHHQKQIEELRQVFTFELEQDDIILLNEIFAAEELYTTIRNDSEENESKSNSWNQQQPQQPQLSFIQSSSTGLFLPKKR